MKYGGDLMDDEVKHDTLNSLVVIRRLNDSIQPVVNNLISYISKQERVAFEISCSQIDTLKRSMELLDKEIKSLLKLYSNT
jgi:hypothetical protein